MQKSALMIGEYGSSVMRPYSLVLGFRSASIFLWNVVSGCLGI